MADSRNVNQATGKEAQGVVQVKHYKETYETKAGPGGAVSIGGGKGLGSGAVQGLLEQVWTQVE